MISAVALIAGFAVKQEGIGVRFNPKIGEKYRYKVELKDPQTNLEITPGLKTFAIFKVAGFKDGRYTIHQTTESQSPDQVPEVRLDSTYRVDSQLNSELITDSAASSVDLVKGIVYDLAGCFLITFNSDPMKLNEAWKVPFDFAGLQKKYLSKGGDTTVIERMTGGGDKTTTLLKYDDKIAEFTSKLNLKLMFRELDESTSTVISTYDVHTTVDRTLGLPIKLENTVVVEISSGVKKQTTTVNVQMERV